MKSIINSAHRAFLLRVANEGGAVLILMSMLLMAMVMILATVIDLSRQQIVAKQVQTVVDAAVLAAAQELNGRKDGWLASKRFAVNVLRQSKIAEAQDALGEGFSLAGGTIDPYESDSSYRGTIGTAGDKIAVAVERGAYWVDSDSGSMQFTSFEGERSKHQLNTYLIANAVKVRVSYRGLGTFFGRTLGMTVFGDIEREAVAVKDSPEECASAIALPACSVLLDTNPYLARRYQTEELKPRDQCFREVLITEADNDTASRRDGITRYHSFNPLPLIDRAEGLSGATTRVGAGNPGSRTRVARETICPFSREMPGGKVQNCKAFRADGVLGVPAPISEAGGRAASVSEVHNVFKLPNSCTKVKLGQRFKPLEATNFLNDTSFERTLADTINIGGSSFRDAFISGTDPRPNFPFVRRYREDLLDKYAEQRMHFPLNGPNGTVIRNMFMGSQGGASAEVGSQWAYNFSNPLCHSSRLPYNDPYLARAKEITVMLLAPTGDGSNYCDFQAVFEQQDQQSEPPKARTEPIVVGFMKAYLFDFNLSSLRDPVRFEPSAASRDNGINYDLRDGNPLGMQLAQITGEQKMGEFKEYLQKHSDWFEQVQDCRQNAREACSGSSGNGGGRGRGAADGGSSGRPACDYQALQQAQMQCWSSVSRPAAPAAPPPNKLSACFDVPDVQALFSGLRNACNAPFANTENCQNVTNQVNVRLNKPYEDPLPGKHCVPLLKNAGAPAKPESWEIRDLDEQYGCGGLRVRLSCEPNKSIPGITPWTAARTTLVN